MLLTLQHLLLLDVLSLSHSRPSHRLEDVSSNTSAANCSGVNPLDPTAVNALKSLYSEWSSKTPDIKDALPGWTTNISECSGPCESGWYGVYCDIGLEQHVVAL
ncbi:unnamed protein product [Sphagnum jensenii]|uniref:Leucine-rich repeat-containing N-terminal plant-type domain-containing protein n=1 Tax=Sphagnum jensenii TaxID=128206 RepID=A0ABP0VZ64_9BRYO